MTREELKALIADGPVILDGATGTNLMEKGMPMGVCPEAWILENKEIMIDLQRRYVEAGTQILYAPTFRGRVANGEAPDKLDIPMFQKALGEEYVLLIKQHPLVRVRPEVPKECRGFAMDVTETMAIDDLLCVADICISDYSSLVFEYSLFEKPMIFFAYDKAEYDDWRGFYYNYEEMTPGPICTENEEMLDYILHLDTRFDKQQVIDFKYKFMRSCDGHATERILDMVMGEQKSAKKEAAAK